MHVSRIALCSALLVAAAGRVSADPLREPFFPAPTTGIAIQLDPLVALPAEATGSGEPSGVEYVLPIQGSNTLFATSTL